MALCPTTATASKRVGATAAKPWPHFGHTWGVSNAIDAYGELGICAAQEVFSPLTRTTLNRSILTGGSAFTARQRSNRLPSKPFGHIWLRSR
jgi:hypothetical protein